MKTQIESILRNELKIVDNTDMFPDSEPAIVNIETAADKIMKLFTIHAVIGNPTQLEPVLTQIEHINDLGKSKWYEVVYFDENWCSYAGSKTFDDGEKVIKWKYTKDCL